MKIDVPTDAAAGTMSATAPVSSESVPTTINRRRTLRRSGEYKPNALIHASYALSPGGRLGRARSLECDAIVLLLGPRRWVREGDRPSVLLGKHRRRAGPEDSH